MNFSRTIIDFTTITANIRFCIEKDINSLDINNLIEYFDLLFIRFYKLFVIRDSELRALNTLIFSTIL